MEKNWRHYTQFASETELRIIAAQNSMALNPGSRLGQYEIVGLIGAGGMGEVYQANDTELRRRVALKILPSDVADDRERRRGFVQEARTVAAINHPNVAHDVTPTGRSSITVVLNWAAGLKN
jgi:serine/threonine protein kinase